MPEQKKAQLARIRELEERLAEAEETLRALRDGEVDAIVAAGPDGDRVYTLKGADESYRIMVEEMGEGALTVTSDGLILFSNMPFAAMVQRPLARVIGSQLADFIAAADRVLISALLTSAGKRKAEVQLVTAGGETRPVYLSIQNMMLSGAECRCVIVTDLSDQKRYSEIAAVLDAVPIGVFIAKDAECLNIRGNRAAYELLRMAGTGNVSPSAEGQAEARHWHEMKDGREIPANELPMQRAAHTGQSVRDYEFEMQFDDGVCRSWLGNAVPLFDETGKPSGAVGSFIDFTERRRTAEALEAAHVELRDLGTAITQDLMEPLRAVVRLTRRVAEECHGKAGEVAEGYIADSLAGALQVERMLQALAAYRAVTDRGAVRLTAVDCNEVVERTLGALQAAIAQSGAKITAELLPTLMAEESMLDHVFQTLIDNAIRYRDQAAPRIHISAVNTFDRWLFTVRDNGIGIAQKNAEQVFGMFKRLHGSERPGNGLNLSLSRKLVERQGGRIWVESAAGEGAAFRFTIPRAPEAGVVLPGERE